MHLQPEDCLANLALHDLLVKVRIFFCRLRKLLLALNLFMHNVEHVLGAHVTKQVFCMAFKLLDHAWTERRATRDQFGQVGAHMSNGVLVACESNVERLVWTSAM